MTPGILTNLLTLGALVAGGASQMPGLSATLWGQALVAVAGFLAGWAHMKKPGQ